VRWATFLVRTHLAPADPVLTWCSLSAIS
jgi:hypothetical protein